MKRFFTWWILVGVFSLLLTFLLFSPPQDNGGDIVEYFGMTQSLLNHASINLTEKDRISLQQHLNLGYFIDVSSTEQNGGFLYYLLGKDGNTYSVHFFAYSLIATPIRFLLEFVGQPALYVFRVVNILLLISTLALIFYHFRQEEFTKRVLLLLILISPLVWFIVWPGPDMYFICLLFLGIFLFRAQNYGLATTSFALASWHSQPLLILALCSLAYMLYKNFHVTIDLQKKYFHAKIHLQSLLFGVLIAEILFLPYFINLLFFGVLTPWTILQDGWTKVYGFGLYNISFNRLFEQFFDLNIGLFWYAPFIMIGAIYFTIQNGLRNKKVFLIIGVLLLTAIGYQTNPAWHYGTVGYGPTRHIIFILPFLITILATHLRPVTSHGIFLLLLILSQASILFFNGFLTPTLSNSHRHSPYATFVLNNYPSLYNPTPEIFVDRTNHTDLKYLHTAIYTYNEKCKKAYVIKTEKEILVETCGAIPKRYQQALENEYLRKTNFPRSVTTTQATFWPDPASCLNPFRSQPFVCMASIPDVITHTGITDKKRIHPIALTPGAWEIIPGEPLHLTIPPGYIIHHRSLEGIYVTY